MSHLALEVMRRILAGQGGPQETESAAEHLDSCDRCRAQASTIVDELRAKTPGLRGEGALQPVFDRIDRERQRGVEYLAAFAERAAQRRTNRRSQRDRVRMAKACHTIVFVDLVLDELKEQSSWTEAEFLASLALLSIDAMSQGKQITEVASHDLQAKVWTAVANSRRRAAEWTRAHQAQKDAERHRRQGTGEPRLEAALLSISASILADEGHIAEALGALERCRSIYHDFAEWALLARVLVKTANVVAGTDPAKGLAALDQADPLIPAEDSYLTLLAELLRVECLIEVQKPTEALQVFRRCRPLLFATPRIRMQIRGGFTGARLLDALGFNQQSERLFDEVVDRDIEHELYKDAFLDLLYLYERHMKAGDLEKAARICRKALTDAVLAAITHDQMRDLWTQLLEAAQHHALSQDLLRDLRQYLSVHWKHPAGTPPVVVSSR